MKSPVPEWLPVGCASCKHLNQDAPLLCAAYPQGIPVWISGNNDSHLTPYPDDHGIQYEPSFEFIQKLMDEGILATDSLLLAKSLPVAIKTEEENERMLAEVSKLMSKGEDHLTPEESALLETMAILIEEFDLIEEFERRFYKIEDAASDNS